MQRKLIWDIPTRVSHWALAVAIGGAFLIGQFAGEHSRFFDYHAVFGIAAIGVLLLRIAWGIVGTRYARFSSLVLAPTKLVAYIKAVISGVPADYEAHNPATSWAGLLMYFLLLSIVATGLIVGAGYESAKDAHQVLVYGLLGVVAIHVTGVVLRMLQSREMLVMAMVDGRKRSPQGTAILSGRPFMGMLFVMIVGLFSARLVANYDAQAHHTHLPLIGTRISLGEGEGDYAGHSDRQHDRDED